MARSTFYYHIDRLNQGDKYAEEKKIILQIYQENKGRYGYRRITMELKHRGYNLNHKTVLKLMNLCGIKSLVRVKKYRSYKGDTGITAPNLLARNFNADEPNTKWATDVTEFSISGIKLYLAPIIDLYNREIISYSISYRPTFQQITDMLESAFKKIPDNTGLILHSDQGWQYRMKEFNFLLQKKGIRQSMSRKGNCLDNAVIENFFGLLKSELLYLHKFESVELFRRELDRYIKYYNNDRIKLKLNGLSPVMFRTKRSINNNE
jgi:Transposase and inactivated derivatives